MSVEDVCEKGIVGKRSSLCEGPRVRPSGEFREFARKAVGYILQGHKVDRGRTS